MSDLKNIHISENPNGEIASLINQLAPSALFVLTDANTKKHCYPLLKPLLPKHKVLVIPKGEQHKNLETCQLVWNWLTEFQADRSALLINLGGGVVGDLGGFCAGVYKRGIRFIQIPTTLLAMADASVGGKTGIDYQGFKNHIGLFAQPEQVVIYTDFLKTLPETELISGWAEVVKHCLIADSQKWQEIKHIEPQEASMLSWVAHAVSIKSNITTQDPTEKGLRKGLNFGHTIGHGIESYFLAQEKPILHGFAIAAGMAIESFIAWKKKLISAEELEEIEEFMLSTFGVIRLEKEHIQPIVALMKQDKKNENGHIFLALPNGIGQVKVHVPVTTKEIVEAINWYRG
jgi:3-dehydroquinate synthase